MSTQLSLDVADTAVNVNGTAITVNSGLIIVEMTATAFGNDGKIILKGSSDGTLFTTFDDPSTASGKAEYTENSIRKVELRQGWLIRADYDKTAGGANGTVIKALVSF